MVKKFSAINSNDWQCYGGIRCNCSGTEVIIETIYSINSISYLAVYALLWIALVHLSCLPFPKF